jgi:hypothetical protein
MRFGIWNVGSMYRAASLRAVVKEISKYMLLNVHRSSDVRQIEIHTAELLVPDPSPFCG